MTDLEQEQEWLINRIQYVHASILRSEADIEFLKTSLKVYQAELDLLVKEAKCQK